MLTGSHSPEPGQRALCLSPASKTHGKIHPRRLPCRAAKNSSRELVLVVVAAGPGRAWIRMNTVSEEQPHNLRCQFWLAGKVRNPPRRYRALFAFHTNQCVWNQRLYPTMTKVYYCFVYESKRVEPMWASNDNQSLLLHHFSASDNQSAFASFRKTKISLQCIGRIVVASKRQADYIPQDLNNATLTESLPSHFERETLCFSIVYSMRQLNKKIA
jgi:hypothetical protein